MVKTALNSLQKPIPYKKSLLDKETPGQRTNKISYFFNLPTLKNKRGKTIPHSNPNSKYPFNVSLKFTLSLPKGSTLHSD